MKDVRVEIRHIIQDPHKEDWEWAIIRDGGCLLMSEAEREIVLLCKGDRWRHPEHIEPTRQRVALWRQLHNLADGREA